MARVLITRPLLDAERLAGRLRAAGHEPLVSPLLDVAAVPWDMPDGPVEAVMFTSRQAPPAIGARGEAIRHLPVFPIGPGTAAAALAAGFTDVRNHVEGDQRQLLATVAASGLRRVLFLSGEDVRGDPVGYLAEAGVEAVRRVVYRAELAGGFRPEAGEALAANALDWALLMSPRTARLFLKLYDELQGVEPQSLRLGCISRAVAAPLAKRPWREVAIAEAATEDSLLAATMLLCDKPA